MPADPNSRVTENVPGAFYVDSSCIDCDVCRDAAPENFTRSFKHAYSYVSKQPGNETERAACEEALEACPVEAIGNDG
jgi:ferredoxin